MRLFSYFFQETFIPCQFFLHNFSSNHCKNSELGESIFYLYACQLAQSFMALGWFGPCQVPSGNLKILNQPVVLVPEGRPVGHPFKVHPWSNLDKKKYP
jgi:hypothetical protein